METIAITLNLPEPLAKEASEQGLLVPEVLEWLLREEIRRRRMDELREYVRDLRAVAAPPLTQEELDSEIHAARNERQRRCESRS